MTEQERPSLSLDTFKKKAIELFERDATALDDIGLLHPNTISRSCERAVEEVIDEYMIKPMDFYVDFIAPNSPFKEKDVNEQYETREEIDKFVKRRIAQITNKSIHAHEQKLVEIQRERIHNFRPENRPLI
jgi:protein associated with RNAse G/E